MTETSSIMASVNLPWPSRTLHPNARPHWSKKASATKAARFTASTMAKSSGLTSIRADSLKVTCIFSPPDNRARDQDGMLSSCKAYFDGIADVIGIDDSKWLHQAPLWGLPCKGGNVRIQIEVAE